MTPSPLRPTPPSVPMSLRVGVSSDSHGPGSATPQDPTAAPTLRSGSRDLGILGAKDAVDFASPHGDWLRLQ